MNVKKEVVIRIRKVLHDELTKCENKIRDNKYRFQRFKEEHKKLVEEQTLLKREKTSLLEAINSIDRGEQINVGTKENK